VKVYRTETTVSEKGVVKIKGVPFKKGEKVRIIILGDRVIKKERREYSLRGKPVKYEAPFESVAQNEWEVLR